MEQVKVSVLLDKEAAHLELQVVYGAKLADEKFINGWRIQKPGLGLAGYVEHIHGGRVQILGNTEISYLKSLKSYDRKDALSKLCSKNISCFVVTKNLEIPKELLAAVKESKIPLFKTPHISSEAITEIQVYLEEHLAPEAVMHGVLLDIFGIGVLVTGRSGIGKSECAIELIKRGHRLVADDAVICKKKSDLLIGTSSSLLRNHIEVRGLGILNIKDMFGVTAIRLKKRLELVIEFLDWEEHADYDRLGLENKVLEKLGVKIPKIELPITAGRNMAVIVEAAARNHLLKIMGYDAGREFSDRLMNTINVKSKNSLDKGLSGGVKFDRGLE